MVYNMVDGSILWCFRLQLAYLLVHHAAGTATFCEKNTIPYRVSVSRDSSLLLDCTTLPKCFSDDTLTGSAGLFRRPTEIGENRATGTLSNSTRKNTICKDISWSSPCFNGGSWFGGGSLFVSTKKCCHLDGLKGLRYVGKKILHSGEMFTGGEILQNNFMIAFDFIADVRKFKDGQRFKYLIVVARMDCIPELPAIDGKSVVRQRASHTSLFLVHQTAGTATFCEKNTIPYRVSVSRDSSLLLDCTTLPKCFSDGTVTGSAGLFRRATEIGKSRTKGTLSNSIRKKTICKTTSWSSPCFNESSWFGGGALFASMKKCCHLDGLKVMRNVGQKILHSGEMFTGGEIRQNNSMLAFDFIADVRKLKDGQRFKYLVVVARMDCNPEPSASDGKSIDGQKAPHAAPIDLQSKQLTLQPPTLQSEASIPSEHAKEPLHELSALLKTARLSSESAHQNNKEKEPPLPNADKKDPESTTLESLRKEHGTKDSSQDDSAACFISPSGHKCCSRQVMEVLSQMATVVTNEMNSGDNETTIQKSMIRYIEKETRRKFCTPFEIIISKSEFAAKSHANGASEMDGVALGCKMQVRIGGRIRIRRQTEKAQNLLEDAPRHQEALKFIVLIYSTVVNANSKNSKSLSFPELPEVPPSPPANSASKAANSSSNSTSNSANTGNGVNKGSFGNIAQGNNWASANAANPVKPPPPIAQDDMHTCFSGDGTVETENGVKLMRDLVVGDKVLSTTSKRLLAFSPVIFFLHRNPQQSALFIEIETENGAKIKLTENHFLYVTDCQSAVYHRIYARQAKINQCVPQLLDKEKKRFSLTPIVNISRVWQTGIYAPLTLTGKIAVNGILASCHSSIAGQHRLHQSYFHALKKLQSWIDWAADFIFVDMQIFTNEFGFIFGAQFLISVYDLIVPQLTVLS